MVEPSKNSMTWAWFMKRTVWSFCLLLILPYKNTIWAITMNTFVRNHKFLTLVGVVAAGSSTLLLKKENRYFFFADWEDVLSLCNSSIAFHETWNGAKRGFKLTRTVLGIALDYKWSFRGLDMGTQAFKDVEKVVDQRSADKTLKLFLYLK